MDPKTGVPTHPSLHRSTSLSVPVMVRVSFKPLMPDSETGDSLGAGPCYHLHQGQIDGHKDGCIGHSYMDIDVNGIWAKTRVIICIYMCKICDNMCIFHVRSILASFRCDLLSCTFKHFK